METKLGKGQQREKETKDYVVCIYLTMTASAHTQSKSNFVFKKSHSCTDVRSVRSPAGSSLAEVDFI